MKCDNIFPATQYHLSSPKRLSEDDQRLILDAMKIPGAGLVAATVPETLVRVSAISFVGSRIIITTSHNIGVDDTDEYAKVFMAVIEKAIND